MERFLQYLTSVVLLLALSACGVTKHLPAEGYMLTKSKIETDSEAPSEERIKSGELSDYVRQMPSKKLLWTNFPAWLYLQADPAKDNGWHNFIRKIGSAPVLLDTALTEESAKNLKDYMTSRGFYESESDYTVKYNKRKRKAKITYTVRQRRPFRIASLSYDFRDDFLRQVILEDSSSTLLAVGDIFDANVLGAERKRITDYLKNRGYYNFAEQNISFAADTTAGDHLVDLTMVVRQHLSGYNANDEPILDNNSVYRIREIIVHSDYDPALAASDPTYTSRLDTTDYNGLRIVSHGKSKIQPHTLRRAIKLYPDYIYSYDDEQRTYDDLLHLNYYKSARIYFDEAASSGDNLVTYIGDDEKGTTHTTEKSLVCRIYCTPTKKQSYTVNMEATYTQIYYGLKPSVSYTNRNLFRGAEMFNLSLSGGYEFNRGKEAGTNAFEIGGTASLYVPRFIAPFKIDRTNRLAGPQTRLEVSLMKQNRSFYDRIISGGHIAYTWSNGRRSSYEFRPLDLNVIRVRRVDADFLLGIKNRYLWSSYQSQLVPAISGTYVYNAAARNGSGKSLTFRLNIEMAGNISYLLSSALSERVPQTIDAGNSAEAVTWNAYQLFKIPFSQYFRAEANISRLIPLGERTALAYRFLAGIGIAYGNAQSMPYDRQFYAGGSTSMRGWPVRGLGPGDSNPSNDRFDMVRVGNMRLEANVEMRFPLWDSFRGAVFFDTGNIWNALIPGGTEEDGIFRFDTFFPQLGLNTGLGIRYDLGIAVVRLDWGIRLHDHGKPVGQRWIRNFKLSNTALSFGIGYPF
jgi:hypothetical protein